MADSASIDAHASRATKLSRRSLIAAGAAGAVGLAVSACAGRKPVSGKTSAPSPARLSPDVAVATRALSEIRTARVAASSTLSRFPAARSRLTALVGLHQVHEGSLIDAVPVRAQTTATPAPYVVPRRSGAALRKLLAREQRLHNTLGELSLRAQSGDFARLLASMGAAVSQQLAAGPV